MNLKHLLAGVAFAALPSASQAATINLDTLYTFGFSGVGTPITGASGALCNNPACNGSPAGTSFEFTLTGMAQLIVQDLFESVDQFALYDLLGGGFIGVTSTPSAGGACGADFTCASSDTRYSSGVFDLGPGSYSIAGTQVAGIPGAGALIVQTITPVPTPASLPLLGAALLGLGLVWRRRTT